MQRYDLVGDYDFIDDYAVSIAPVSDGDYVLYRDAINAIADARAAAITAILDGCPNDGSDAEIILRQAWERVRTMQRNEMI